MNTTGTLQTATVISKTTQTNMGSAIPCENAEYITVYLDYTKGDETGVDIILNKLLSVDGAKYQEREWASSSGVLTSNVQKIRLTATGKYTYSFFIEGSNWVQFTQGGSNNDGTPTGTLAASYVMSN